jgi:hypothetical protein
MSDHDHTKQRIIASVFDKRNSGAAIQETYVGHIKIWEDAGEDSGKKPRYILLSRMLLSSVDWIAQTIPQRVAMELVSFTSQSLTQTARSP